MADKKSATLEFTRAYLRQKPDAPFAEIRDAAAEEGLKIYPIVFGRAKALEGLVEVAPYGSKKKEREAAARKKADAARAAAQPDPLPAPEVPPIAGIDAMIQGVRANLDERERYRTALIKISEILDAVLDQGAENGES